MDTDFYRYSPRHSNSIAVSVIIHCGVDSNITATSSDRMGSKMSSSMGDMRFFMESEQSANSMASQSIEGTPKVNHINGVDLHLKPINYPPLTN